jgi:hypothetical protein
MAFTILLLSGCGTGGNDSEADRQPPPVEDTVFGELTGAMDKARAVEDTTLQRKEELDRALEQQEKAGSQ